MKTRIFVASALALAFLAPAAHALTVVNQDQSAYTIKIMPKGGKEMDLAVKAGAKADVDCKAGCQLSLNGKTEDVTGKLAKIVIKDGKFVM